LVFSGRMRGCTNLAFAVLSVLGSAVIASACENGTTSAAIPVYVPPATDASQTYVLPDAGVDAPPSVDGARDGASDARKADGAGDAASSGASSSEGVYEGGLDGSSGSSSSSTSSSATSISSTSSSTSSTSS
jgi:hypothetical protein